MAFAVANISALEQSGRPMIHSHSHYAVSFQIVAKFIKWAKFDGRDMR